MAKAAYHNAVALQAEGRFYDAAKLYRHVLPGRRYLLGEHPGPDFLIIGSPRAGTTWLKKVLAAHPQVRILADEIHYFSMRYNEPPSTYVEMFKSGLYKGAYVDTPGPAVYGEKSPTYLAINRAKVALCAALFPDVRIVCTIREPVARAWSHLQLLGPDPERLSEQQYRKIIKFGRYSTCLANWASQFPPEQIHLIDFADIAADPHRVFDDVCRHIGAPRMEPWEGLLRTRDPVGPEPPREIRRRLEAEYAGEAYDLPTLQAVIQARGGPPAAAAE